MCARARSTISWVRPPPAVVTTTGCARLGQRNSFYRHMQPETTGFHPFGTAGTSSLSSFLVRSVGYIFVLPVHTPLSHPSSVSAHTHINSFSIQHPSSFSLRPFAKRLQRLSIRHRIRSCVNKQADSFSVTKLQPLLVAPEQQHAHILQERSPPRRPFNTSPTSTPNTQYRHHDRRHADADRLGPHSYPAQRLLLGRGPRQGPARGAEQAARHQHSSRHDAGPAAVADALAAGVDLRWSVNRTACKELNDCRLPPSLVWCELQCNSLNRYLHHCGEVLSTLLPPTADLTSDSNLNRNLNHSAQR